MSVEVVLLSVISTLFLFCFVIGIVVLIVWVRRLDVQLQIMATEVANMRDMMATLTRSLLNARGD